MDRCHAQSGVELRELSPDQLHACAWNEWRAAEHWVGDGATVASVRRDIAALKETQ